MWAFVAFASDASNLIANDTNDNRDVFVKDMQRFIKREANLFIDDTEEKADDEEEINDTDTDNKIDLWMEEFETNFPGLEIRDSHQFDPNI